MIATIKSIFIHTSVFEWNQADTEVRVFNLKDVPHCPSDPTSTIYFRPDHLRTQSTGIIYSFILFRKNPKAVIAEFHCTQHAPGQWSSPPKAPFGGITAEKGCKANELEFFLNCIKEWMANLGGKKLTVSTSAACYNPTLHPLLRQCYLSTEFISTRTLINHHILVNALKFEHSIYPSERRRLRKSEDADFQAYLCKEHSIDMIYPFLLKCAERNGYELSLSKCQLGTLLTRFPEDFLVFSVNNKGQLIALAIMVKVTSDILYYFLSAFDPQYRSYSPMVLLLKNVYEFCQQNDFSILDLGTSLDRHGNNKPSLARFKKNIGGIECEKITYELVF